MAAEKNNPTTEPTDDQEPDELDDDAEETGDEDEESGTEAEWTPPTKAEWDAAQARLAAEQAKLKRARLQAQKLREGGRGGADGKPGPEAAAAAQADVQKWQTRAVTTAARAELLARGAEPDMVDLALGRLKAAEIEFGDDDQPDLEEWLDDMQDRYPRLFKAAEAAPSAPASRPRPGKVEPGGKTPVRPKLSLGQQILANSSQGIRPRRRP